MRNHLKDICREEKNEIRLKTDATAQGLVDLMVSNGGLKEKTRERYLSRRKERNEMN